MNHKIRFCFLFLAFVLLKPAIVFASEQPLVIGLNADLSAADSYTGQAIRLGAEIALDEINAAGGVLGRPLVLELYDHRRNPARGIDNVERLASRDDVIAILGGKHTPVILAELETIHAWGIPYLVPWAAGTPIIDNGYTPNYVFRVSVRDALAGPFLVEHALDLGFQRLGLVLEQTGWGRSNEVSLTQALEEQGLAPARVEWFNWGEQNFAATARRMLDADVDAMIFVGNEPDGVSFVRGVLENEVTAQLPIISHWGIVGGGFTQALASDLDRVDLTFLQTFSFYTPPLPERAARLAEKAGPTDAPPAVAHAYDLIHILVRAIELAGTDDRAQVRDALEQIDFHPGVMRDYAPPFTAERHDALDASDFIMARYVDGRILPLSLSAQEP